ncbi:hypothetical protein SESBI_30914 [Sesbania bispinosa]|nr:hypothetical protein SESBI_30914 [Sesbania bispinosa]
MDVEKAAPQSEEGTTNGSQSKGLRVKSPASRVKSSGVSSINDSCGKKTEEKQCYVGLVKRNLRVKSPAKKSPSTKGKDAAASQKHNMATKSKVAEVVKEKNPAQSRHNMVLRQKSPTKRWCGQSHSQGEAQVHLKSPSKGGVVQSEGEVNLNGTTEAAVGQNQGQVNLNGPTEAAMGQNHGQVNLNGLAEDVVGQSQGQVNLKNSKEVVVGQSNLRRSVRKVVVGQNQTAEPEGQQTVINNTTNEGCGEGEETKTDKVKRPSR